MAGVYCITATLQVQLVTGYPLKLLLESMPWQVTETPYYYKLVQMAEIILYLNISLKWHNGGSWVGLTYIIEKITWAQKLNLVFWEVWIRSGPSRVQPCTIFIIVLLLLSFSVGPSCALRLRVMFKMYVTVWSKSNEEPESRSKQCELSQNESDPQLMNLHQCIKNHKNPKMRYTRVEHWDMSRVTISA